MKIIKLFLRCILAFFIGLLFSVALSVSIMIISAMISVSYVMEDNMVLLYIISFFILIFPFVMVLFTFIAEVRIMLVKIRKEVSLSEVEKTGIDKEDLDNECHEYFRDYVKYVFKDDDVGMRRILSDKCYDDYITSYEMLKKQNLGDKYKIDSCNLVDVKTIGGLLYFEYDYKIFQSICSYNKKVLKNRKIIYYKVVYSYKPIINEKNCKSCGAVLKNTYKCPSCGKLLKYDEHILKIEKIDSVKVINRWC